MRRVIVNADDFGLTRGVNEAVRKAHSDGVLTSTTVLVNGSHAAEAADLPRTWPDLGVGIHVNLSRGRSSSPPEEVPSLVDADGTFFTRMALFRRLVRGQIRREEVFKEVSSQILALRGLGVEPTHWDAHESIAFWPGLRGPTATAAYAAGLRRVRTPRVWIVESGREPRVARRRWRRSRARRWLTDANRVAAHVSLSRQFHRPGWLVSPNLVVGGDYAFRWRAALSSLPPGVSEVVSHPGYVDAELRAAEPGLVDDRAIDLAALLQPAVRNWLRDQEATLISFRDL